jgi:hypothetical protein
MYEKSKKTFRNPYVLLKCQLKTQLHILCFLYTRCFLDFLKEENLCVCIRHVRNVGHEGQVRQVRQVRHARPVRQVRQVRKTSEKDKLERQGRKTS